MKETQLAVIYSLSVAKHFSFCKYVKKPANAPLWLGQYVSVYLLSGVSEDYVQWNDLLFL